MFSLLADRHHHRSHIGHVSVSCCDKHIDLCNALQTQTSHPGTDDGDDPA